MMIDAIDIAVLWLAFNVGFLFGAWWQANANKETEDGP